MRRVFTAGLALMLSLAVAAAARPAPSSLRAAGAGALDYVKACRSVKKDAQGGTRCGATFPLGIPSSSKNVWFFAGYKGTGKGGLLTANILDPKTNGPVASPVVLGNVRYDPGEWWWRWDGPFPKLSIKITLSYKGKPLRGEYLFRFI